MSKHTVKSEHSPRLRHQAEALIREGAPPRAANHWATGVEALTLLHGLASSPASAGDALKLLHELQVHQVELDLQHEQMEQSRRELTEELHHYAELYNFAPVGYFTVDIEGKIVKANLAAAQLFGVEQDVLSGQRIDNFLAPESRPELAGLLKRLRNGGPGETFEAQALNGGSGSRRLQVVATVSPDSQSFLLAFVDRAAP